VLPCNIIQHNGVSDLETYWIRHGGGGGKEQSRCLRIEEEESPLSVLRAFLSCSARSLLPRKIHILPVPDLHHAINTT
jgi:hypothetical protein